MTLSKFLFWSIFARIRKIRPFWYINYDKEEAKKLLEEKFNWKYYGGHHLENRMTAFFHSVYAPKKFNSDFRNNTLAALVRESKISRQDAWNKYNEPPYIEKNLVKYFKKRLGLNDQEYEIIMLRTAKSWREYPTYKRSFEILKPIFFILAKANLVPMSFYLKYCFPIKEKNDYNS